jgi:hypothetical protein
MREQPGAPYAFMVNGSLGSAGVLVLNGNLFRKGSSKYEIYRTKNRAV